MDVLLMMYENEERIRAFVVTCPLRPALVARIAGRMQGSYNDASLLEIRFASRSQKRNDARYSTQRLLTGWANEVRLFRAIIPCVRIV